MKHLLGMRESEVVVIFGYVISILGLVYYVEEFTGTYFFIYVFVLLQSIVATPDMIASFLTRNTYQEADLTTS